MLASGPNFGRTVRVQSGCFYVDVAASGQIKIDQNLGSESSRPIGLQRLKIAGSADGWHVFSLSDEPFFIGRTAVYEKSPLKSGDFLRLGPLGPDLQFVLTIDSRQESPAAGEKSPAAGVTQSPTIDLRGLPSANLQETARIPTQGPATGNSHSADQRFRATQLVGSGSAYQQQFPQNVVQAEDLLAGRRKSPKDLASFIDSGDFKYYLAIVAIVVVCALIMMLFIILIVSILRVP